MRGISLLIYRFSMAISVGCHETPKPTGDTKIRYTKSFPITLNMVRRYERSSMNNCSCFVINGIYRSVSQCISLLMCHVYIRVALLSVPHCLFVDCQNRLLTKKLANGRHTATVESSRRSGIQPLPLCCHITTAMSCLICQVNVDGFDCLPVYRDQPSVARRH